MSPKKLYISLVLCTVCSIGFMAFLFIFSRTELKRDHSFKRGFLYYAPKKIHEFDLGHNRSYISGVDEEHIYLGYSGSPVDLAVFDSSFQNKKDIRLSIDRDSIPLRSPRISVIPPYFFLSDGTIPYIFRGKTSDWKGYSKLDEPLFFSNGEPMDSSTIVVRTISSKTNELTLGSLHLSDSASITLSYDLLQKQVDGIFDVDGTLQYNRQRQQLVYTYHYRNQYIVANDSLQLKHLGKTLDTISKAQIEVGTIASKNQQKLSAPALMVNKYSATSGNYLFVNSVLLGRKESLMLWKTSSVVDVYNMDKNSYLFSFYVEDVDKNKLREFRVVHDRFFGLIGNHIVVYQLDEHFKKNNQTKIISTNIQPKSTNMTGEIKKPTPKPQSTKL